MSNKNVTTVLWIRNGNFGVFFVKHNQETLTPKGLRVFLLKTASKQPLLKTSQIVQDWNQSWYFQP
jgi:hypothetical protein